MERIVTEQSTSNLAQSNLTHNKKLSLIRIYRKSHFTQHHQLPASVQYHNYSQHNATCVQKDKHHDEAGQYRQHLQNQPRSTNLNTENTIPSQHKSLQPKNIFDNDYVNCLKKGFTHLYQQSNKIAPKTNNADLFRGPVYYSQRPSEHSHNPQASSQPAIEEEVYKIDKNPKLLKFKVNLKRQNTQKTQKSESSSKLNPLKNTSRILITQLRTQDSKLSQLNRSSLQSRDSEVRKLQPINKRLHAQSYSTQINPKSLKIPKLSEQSKLFHSIKIFEKKQHLLGQIEHHRGLQEKYGDKVFERLMRNNYEQIERKNDFIMKVHYNSSDEPSENTLKSKFIRDIQSGKYPTKFRYQQRPMPLKLKGRTKTMPRSETILYDDDD